MPPIAVVREHFRRRFSHFGYAQVGDGILSDCVGRCRHAGCQRVARKEASIARYRTCEDKSGHGNGDPAAAAFETWMEASRQ